MPFLLIAIITASLRSYGRRYKTVGRHRRTPASAERIEVAALPGSCASAALAGLKSADTPDIAAPTPMSGASVQDVPSGDE